MICIKRCPNCDIVINLWLYITLHCSLGDAIDFYKTLKAQCTKNAMLYNKELEETRIFELLVGLHPDYVHIRVQILGKDPLAPLDKVLSYLSQEDQCHLMAQPQPPIIDHSALVSFSQCGGRGSFRGGGGQCFMMIETN